MTDRDTLFGANSYDGPAFSIRELWVDGQSSWDVTYLGPSYGVLLRRFRDRDSAERFLAKLEGVRLEREWHEQARG